MSLSQLHYTSAPPGPDGSGFRFTAVTPGLPQALLREAEQLIGYEPPRDAPTRPTVDELGVFPAAFSHSVLADGSRLLARTVYTGADYSGRWGNFHAHAVHLPTGTRLPDDLLPITTWDSAQWADRSPGNGVPEPLETLAPGGHFGGDSLIDFAAARAPWLAGFFSDLRELSENRTAPQVVLVEWDSGDVARWIALAGVVLPREEAHRLTFLTYTRRPQHARQQLIGVLPDDARAVTGHGQHYRVHDCSTQRPGAQPVADVWAEVAAAVWLGRAPGLFKEAAALGGGPFQPGPLAVVAMGAGIDAGPGGRGAAADWLVEHSASVGGDRLRGLLHTLCESGTGRTPAESAALTRLFGALDGRAPADATAPLAAAVLTEAVRRADGSELPDLRPSAFTDAVRQQLAAELTADLRSGIAREEEVLSGQDTSRRVGLWRIAELLGVDCADLLQGLARRLSRSLLSDPEDTYTPAVRAALEEQFALRAALLEKLDGRAAGDPAAAARMMARTSLPFTGEQALPHLRMCDAVSRADRRDRVSALHTLLRAAGVSPFAEPLVLRTAVRLVWEGGAPSPSEARLLLGETGSDAHRAAGTWRDLVAAALGTPAADREAPALARDLLRSFRTELGQHERGALLLLELAGDVREEAPRHGWITQALDLRAAAGPVEPGVLELAFGAVAERLLADEPPDGELLALAGCRDADLLAAYDLAARSDRVRDRLRVVPAYVADCFAIWTSRPGAGSDWDAVRTGLLEKVLRPVVRALPAEDLADVERCLAERGNRWVTEFASWNQPGAFGRFGRRFGGRGRKPSADSGPRWGDVQPPRKDGRAR